MHTLYDYRLYQNQHREQLEYADRERRARPARRGRSASRLARIGSGGNSAKVHQEPGSRAH